jgi:hypothetical protein
LRCTKAYNIETNTTNKKFYIMYTKKCTRQTYSCNQKEEPSISPSLYIHAYLPDDCLTFLLTGVLTSPLLSSALVLGSEVLLPIPLLMVRDKFRCSGGGKLLSPEVAEELLLVLEPIIKFAAEAIPAEERTPELGRMNSGFVGSAVDGGVVPPRLPGVEFPPRML